MPPLPSGTGEYAAHGPHYAAFGLHYAALGPTALWQHNATLRQHNEALGRHIFRYPSGRGGILYQYNSDSLVDELYIFCQIDNILKNYQLYDYLAKFLMNCYFAK